jgi:hypothetical protein
MGLKIVEETKKAQGGVESCCELGCRMLTSRAVSIRAK